MKKNLLTALAIVASMGVSFAQTFTNGSTGYTTSYGTTGNSCSITSGATARMNGDQTNATAGNITIDPTTKNFKIVSNASIATVALSTPQFVGILASFGTPPTATCNYLNNVDAVAGSVMGVDMSAAANRRIAVTAKASVDGAQMIVHIGYSSASFSPSKSTYNTTGLAGGAGIIRTITLTTTMAEYVVDFADVPADAINWNAMTNKDQINVFGFDPRTASTTYEIGAIKYGSDAPAATTGTSSATVVNEQVNVFPNPAKGAFNVDVTAMNVESALVKVMNANGSVVKELNVSGTSSISTEGLNAGIYMIQVTAANKVANKKVVVQ